MFCGVIETLDIWIGFDGSTAIGFAARFTVAQTIYQTQFSSHRDFDRLMPLF
jgi:hypothetical protein